MCLVAKVIGISHANFHYNRPTTVIQDYASLILGRNVEARTKQKVRRTLKPTSMKSQQVISPEWCIYT